MIIEEKVYEKMFWKVLNQQFTGQNDKRVTHKKQPEDHSSFCF